jgi:hypothetical protein
VQERVACGQRALKITDSFERRVIEEELLREAVIVSERAKARADAAVVGEERARARAEEASVRMCTAVEVAESAERDMRRESMELLRERLKWAYRRGRLSALLAEAKAMHATLEASLKRREEKRAFRDLVPVGSGFQDLDDRVRRCVT